MNTRPHDWPAFDSTNKPWTRWWWLGNAVDRDGIRDLLERYAAAGLGGVEITPIYGVVGDDAQEVPYLSDAWVALLQFAIEEAGRLGMGVDMPTGTGWPFGGPQVADENALDKLVVRKFSADAPLPLANAGEKLLAVCAVDAGGNRARIDPAAVDQASPVGTTAYAAFLAWGGQNVKRAAPGGEGKCINPFSRAALDAYLARFDKALGALPPGALRCHFHDSFEYRANFSAELIAEFGKRRGYDLGLYLDVLHGDDPDAETAARVLTDYRQTVGELLLENFTRSWSAWVRERGSLSRNQAHGSPGNLLDLYAVSDIPETETFGGAGDYVTNKFASSAAHLAGRKLCSSETCTWLAEHFQVTLAQCKDAIDGIFVSGINHVFYHGTAYSPISETWPGRLFYASTTFAPQDPIWRDFPTLNAYIARVQSVLQAGETDNDFLLYWPLDDFWMRHPHEYMFDILGKWLKGEPFDALARALFDLGGQFDYVSDAQLAALAARAGRYKAVVVPPCRYCAPETIDALTTLAESGVSIIMVGALPEDVPGNARLDERRQKLAAAKSRLAAVAKTADAADVADALEAAGVRLERDAARHGLQLTRRRTDDATEYFVANRTRKPLDAMIAFNCPQGEIVFRDPMTGVVGEAPQTSERSVRVQLFPGQSLLVRALPSRGDSDGAPWRYLDRASEPIAISGPWSVEFVDPVLPGRATASVLGSWTDLPLVGADAYAGTARYTAIFDAPGSPADEWLIDFGQVADSASVTVNGQSVGTLIGSPWHVVVSDLKATGNELWVEVTNVAANRIRAMDRKNIPWRKFKDINFVDIQYKRFDASHWPVRPAGLLGPVTLSRLKR